MPRCCSGSRSDPIEFFRWGRVPFARGSDTHARGRSGDRVALGHACQGGSRCAGVRGWDVEGPGSTLAARCGVREVVSRQARFTRNGRRSRARPSRRMDGSELRGGGPSCPAHRLGSESGVPKPKIDRRECAWRAGRYWRAQLDARRENTNGWRGVSALVTVPSTIEACSSLAANRTQLGCNSITGRPQIASRARPHRSPRRVSRLPDLIASRYRCETATEPAC